MKRRFLVWAMLLIYIIIIVVLLFLQYFYEMEARLAENLDRSKLHGPLSLLGILFCGLGLMIFRLFNGFRTRYIKYLHMMCQLLGMIFIFTGYAYSSHFYDRNFNVFPGAETASEPHQIHVTSEAHVALGYLMLGAMVLQFSVAIFIFVYLFAESQVRLMLAPFHDIFGIWIFLCLVATHLTGVHFLYGAIGDWSLETRTYLNDKLNYMSLPAYVGFLIVFIVIICPYFEWELVGPI